MKTYAELSQAPAPPTAATEDALATEPQAAAKAQSAELAGAPKANEPDTKASQADEVREAERIAAAKAGWEALLGKSLGGKAFDLIREHVSFEDLTGYAKQGTAALADLAPFSEGKAFSADDAKALNALAKAFAPELQKLADKWLEGASGQKVFKSISEWVEEHPKAVTAIAASLGALAIGAAVAAIVADADPPALEKMFKIGKGLEVGGALDLASVQSFAVQSAELSMKYSAGGFSARLSGGTKAGEDGAHTQSVTAGVAYEGDGVQASADASWNSEDGASAGAEVKGKGGDDRFKGDYLASIRVNEAGETEVVFNGGIETVIADLPASMRAGLKHKDGDESSTTVEAEMKIGEEGDQQTVKGTYDPKTGAFTLNFGRTAYDGAASLQQSLTQGADGALQTEHTFKYKAGDDLSFDMSHATDGESTTAAVGVDFTTGTFKNSFDLKMKDALSELSLGTAGKVGDFTLGANTTLNLSDARLQQLGLSLGWQDPEAFKSATLKYKLDWQKDNKQYAHNFEGVFEHTVGKWQGRLSGNLQLQGGQMQGANADLLMGRSLNDRWKIIGGATAGGSMVDGTWQNKAGGRLGVQFDNIGVTFGVTKTFGGETETGFRLEIPLGRKR